MSLQPPHKRVIVCLDGTWNEPSEVTENPADKKREPTNVLKLVRAIAPLDDGGIVQCVYYDEGVGTRWGLDKFIGGGLGIGLSENIQQAYRFMANNYRQGDHIFLFGFSRGAYTARSLAGFISAIGFIPKHLLRYVAEAYEIYRLAKKQRQQSIYWKMLQDLDYTPGSRDVPIHFVGVWDTVGALGAPTPILGRLTRGTTRFHNTRLGPRIQNAYHALAIDERRRPFRADLWTGDKHASQHVEQVWFPGVHTNVGGGYQDTNLSDITLNWMMHRAYRHGLRFTKFSTDRYLRLTAEALKQKALRGLEVNSFSTAYQLLRLLGVSSYRRPIGSTPQGSAGSNESAIEAKVHQSALDRYGKVTRYRKNKTQEVEQVYQPPNLPVPIDGVLKGSPYDDPI